MVHILPSVYSPKCFRSKRCGSVAASIYCVRSCLFIQTQRDIVICSSPVYCSMSENGTSIAVLLSKRYTFLPAAENAAFNEMFVKIIIHVPFSSFTATRTSILPTHTSPSLGLWSIVSVKRAFYTTHNACFFCRSYVRIILVYKSYMPVFINKC